MARRQTSIKKRVRAVILVTSGIVLLVAVAAFVIYDAISFRERLVRNLSTLATVIADNSAAPLAFNNPEIGEEILAALRAEPEIVAAVVYDSEGTIFAKYPSTLSSNLLPARLSSSGHEFTDGALVLFTPVIKEQRTIGTLYLRSSLRGLYQQLWRFGIIAAAVLSTSLAAAFLLSMLLQRRISEPILALTETAQSVSRKGDYSVRAPKLTEDEIGMLTDAFNRMLSETQEHERHLAEQARLLDLTVDAVLVRDLQDRITYWNRGAEEMYGHTREEAVGKVSHELLRTEFTEPIDQISDTLQRTNRWHGELVHTRRDGGKIYVASRWTFDRGPQPEYAQILETNSDITERKAFQTELERQVRERTADLEKSQSELLLKIEAEKKLEQQLRQAQKMESLGTLAGGIAHDFNNILNIIGGYASQIVRRAGVNDEISQNLQVINEQVDRGASVVRQLLTTARETETRVTTANANEIVSKLADLVKNTFPRTINVGATIEPTLPNMLADPNQITQALLNICLNARDAMPAGGDLVLRTELIAGKHVQEQYGEAKAERYVCIVVTDTGSGISEDIRTRIFEPFFTTKGIGKGTGLGLAMAYGIVKSHDGIIDVESELGRGSTFRIYLPLLASQDERS